MKTKPLPQLADSARSPDRIGWPASKRQTDLIAEAHSDMATMLVHNLLDWSLNPLERWARNWPRVI